MVEKKLDIEVKKEVKPSVTISTTTSTQKAEEVEIVPNQDFRMAYGDRWYYFTKGAVAKVPKELKEFLLKQGALAVM